MKTDQLYLHNLKMNHQTIVAASSPISPQAHPLLRTLRTELSALEVEAIKAANQKQIRKFK